jgi:hypothetical protein
MVCGAEVGVGSTGRVSLAVGCREIVDAGVTVLVEVGNAIGDAGADELHAVAASTTSPSRDAIPEGLVGTSL